jgi:peptidoglycan/LPS O-acetylase OafA/YrhL
LPRIPQRDHIPARNAGVPSVADLSFPLYLFHIPVMVMVVHFVTPSRMVVAGAVLVVSALALLLIEYQCRAAARRWQSSRRSSMPGSAVATRRA